MSTQGEKPTFYEFTSTWLDKEGVPHFSKKHRIWSGIPIYLLAVFLTSAFQLGAMTYVTLNETDLSIALILAPIIFGGVAFCFRSTFRKILCVEPLDARSIYLTTAVIAIPILALCLIGLDAQYFLWDAQNLLNPGPVVEPPELLNPSLWSEFGVLLCGLLCATTMWNSAMWSAVANRRSRWALVALLTAATGTLAIDRDWFWDRTNLPLAFPTFMILVGTLFLSMKLSLGVGRAGWDKFPKRSIGFVPFAPLVAICIGVDCTFLDYVALDLAETFPITVEQAESLMFFGLFLTLGFLLLVVQYVRHRAEVLAPRSSPPVERSSLLHAEGLQPRALTIYAALYLFAYPVWLLAPFNARASNPRLALFSLGINAGCLLLIVIFVYFRVDRILRWAALEALRGWDKIVLSMVHGVPFLLLFVTLFLLSEDIWRVLTHAETTSFWTAIGVVLVLNFILMMTISFTEVKANNKFANNREVLLALPADFDPARRGQARRILDQKSRSGRREDAGLTFLEYVNGILVVVFFQLVILVPATLATLAVLFLLGRILIDNTLVTDWSNSTAVPIDEVFTPDGPWFRVSILLAIFAMLYMTVTVLRDKQNQGILDAGAQDALRSRLAVRLVHKACSVAVDVPPASDQTDTTVTIPGPYEPPGQRNSRQGGVPAGNGGVNDLQAAVSHHRVW